MMKCICGLELNGKQRFCSDKCRKRASRTNSDKKNAPESNMSDELGQVGHNIPPELSNSDKSDTKSDKSDITPEYMQRLVNEGNKILERQSIEVFNSLVKPENYGLDNCQCKHCQACITNKSTARLNHGEYMTAAELEQNGYDFNRVTLPGDIDYVGVCNQQVAI